jgi:transcriptional regulator with XRE-family HTH domain
MSNLETPNLVRLIGAAIRHERLKQGLKLDELCRLSGVGIATLSNLENGNRDIRLSTLARLLAVLQIELATLLSPSPLGNAISNEEGNGYEVEL